MRFLILFFISVFSFANVCTTPGTYLTVDGEWLRVDSLSGYVQYAYSWGGDVEKWDYNNANPHCVYYDSSKGKYVHRYASQFALISNPCPDGQMFDETTQSCSNPCEPPSGKQPLSLSQSQCNMDYFNTLTGFDARLTDPEWACDNKCYANYIPCVNGKITKNNHCISPQSDPETFLPDECTSPTFGSITPNHVVIPGQPDCHWPAYCNGVRAPEYDMLVACNGADLPDLNTTPYTGIPDSGSNGGLTGSSGDSGSGGSSGGTDYNLSQDFTPVIDKLDDLIRSDTERTNYLDQNQRDRNDRLIANLKAQTDQLHRDLMNLNSQLAGGITVSISGSSSGSGQNSDSGNDSSDGGTFDSTGLDNLGNDIETSNSSLIDFVEGIKGRFQSISNDVNNTIALFQNKPTFNMSTTQSCSYAVNLMNRSYNVDLCKFVSPYKSTISLVFTVIGAFYVLIFAVKYLVARGD